MTPFWQNRFAANVIAPKTISSTNLFVQVYFLYFSVEKHAAVSSQSNFRNGDSSSAATVPGPGARQTHITRRLTWEPGEFKFGGASFGKGDLSNAAHQKKHHIRAPERRPLLASFDRPFWLSKT
uniref:(northern house mosquito) hypothetical protein n=1 Tax=Culex pipiens TaxID=7175 RepID=A0A8D8HFE3_CULPI